MKRLSLRVAYSPFNFRILTFTGWNQNCHVIIGIKTDLSRFVVTMYSGLCEQYVQSTSCFASALVQCDNKSLQKRSYYLKPILTFCGRQRCCVIICKAHRLNSSQEAPCDIRISGYQVLPDLYNLLIDSLIFISLLHIVPISCARCPIYIWYLGE